MKFWSLALLMAAAAYGVSEGANARSVTDRHDATLRQIRIPVHGLTEAPIGHIKFCHYHPDDCHAHGVLNAEIALTSARWKELQAVNQTINLAIKPVSDQSQYGTVEYWTYPTSGKGDCEDYVLLKKRKLMELGWPESALLITVVRDENDEGHAVLTVRTNRGDLILDNKHSRILAWSNTPYTYIKRQSAIDPQRWESLVPLRTEPTISASGAEARQ